MIVIRQYLTSLRLLLALTLVVGLAYPATIYVVGQVAFKSAAQGSLLSANGNVIGSKLIGQNFPGEQWFHSRPSAAGADGYDALSSSSSNAGPNEPSLLELVNSRRAAVAKEENVDPSQVPSDAITASTSGLDPEISPEYAYLQAARVAKNHNVSITEMNSLIARHVSKRIFGFLGEPRVNVLELNNALSSLK